MRTDTLTIQPVAIAGAATEVPAGTRSRRPGGAAARTRGDRPGHHRRGPVGLGLAVMLILSEFVSSFDRPCISLAKRDLRAVGVA